MTFADLTIVTSCTGYGKYLPEWSLSIVRQRIKPGRVCIFTHGTSTDQFRGRDAARMLNEQGIPAEHLHVSDRLDLGVARNRAVAMSATEWVMHLDADDMLFPDAVAELQRVAPSADVVQAGYTRIGPIYGFRTKQHVYEGGNGIEMLTKSALASGNSMFRRRLWEEEPYREDLLGAWDTALWIGFAYLGARFRPTQKVIFQYRQHDDSVFNMRRRSMDWTRVHTSAMLKGLRRRYAGVHVIVPRSIASTQERERNWTFIKQRYEAHHPLWTIVEGFCPTVKWSKGAAIQDALNRSTAEVIIIADADVFVDPAALRQAVDAVYDGAPWAMPHHSVHRLSKDATHLLCQHDTFVAGSQALDRPVYEGCPGGGIVVVRRVLYDAIGGIPLAFQGWGSEDRALALLCNTLLGPCHRGTADLIHLWHPSTTKVESATNLHLLRTLGAAALRGSTALVQSVYGLPRPAASTYHTRPAAIDHTVVADRMAARRIR